MARKVTGQQKPAAPKGAAGVNDLDVLQPDRQVTIGGEIITVREYRFWEGLQVRAKAAPFFHDLFALFDQAGAAPSFDDISDLLGQHQEDTIVLVAQACGKPVEWIRELDDEDGEALLITWWLANAGFFTRRVLRRAAAARMAPANQSHSAGPVSTTPSSKADTSEASESSPD